MGEFTNETIKEGLEFFVGKFLIINSVSLIDIGLFSYQLLLK